MPVRYTWGVMQAVRHLFPFLIAFLVRVLALTLRFRVEDRCGITRGDFKGPLIGALWHNRILLMPVIYNRFCRNRRGNCLTSPSKDGAIIAGVLQHFGIGNVRGSSSRRGSTAMREMTVVLEKGEDIAITPDGPRGPKYHLNPGIVKLSQLTGIPIVPIHVESSRYWEIKSWDAFRIPKPFSHVSVVFGSFYEALPTSDEAAFEAERARFEAWLASGPDAAMPSAKPLA